MTCASWWLVRGDRWHQLDAAAAARACDRHPGRLRLAHLHELPRDAIAVFPYRGE